LASHWYNGALVSFEYKRKTVELIDFYEPSMYETLKAIKEQEIVSTDLPRHNYS
jgi:hypothetical protein